MESGLEINKEEIEVNIRTAKERLKSAKILLEAHQYRDSVSRSYYAFLDAATAALLYRNVFVKTHSGLYKMFAFHMI